MIYRVIRLRIIGNLKIHALQNGKNHLQKVYIRG